MLVLISPAKKLLTQWQSYSGITTVPELHQQSAILIEIMKQKSVEEIASLMDLSNDLAQLNYERYQSFVSDDPAMAQSYPAVLLFQGDVYQGLRAQDWDNETLCYAQQHLGILSGLYGLLRPLDVIQPYRLEMGTRLQNPSGKTLYDFWRSALTGLINQHLQTHRYKILVNLASTEYFSAVNVKELAHPVLTVNFYERKNGVLKMIGIHAKKARGTMAKYLMQHRVDDVTGIQHFSELGYQYHPQTSSDVHLDFVRD